MKKAIFLIITSLFAACLAYGQAHSNLFDRLQGISNNGVDFYNVDGIEITCQKKPIDFSAKNIVKNFKQLKIKENKLVQRESWLNSPNFHVFKSEENPKGVEKNISYYFIENKAKEVVAFTFLTINKKDIEFEKEFIRLAINNEIPGTIFAANQIDSINFAGRKISLGGFCYWMGINNVQCGHYGQMNWSVHKYFEDAKQTVQNQFLKIASGKKGKIVSDTQVSVDFEGTATTARKIIYDFTGLTSVLAGMTGGKTLTVYFVAAPVRDNYVSCVMSFWNNDQVNPVGLSPLLAQVMKLKE